MSARGLFLALCLFAVAGVAACDTVQPARFPHVPHVTGACGGPGQRACLTCVTCHGAIRNVDEQAYPKPSVCAACHKGEKETALAASSPSRPRTSPLGRSIRFSHQRHLTMPEIKSQCMKCHKGVPDEEAKSPVFPPMAECLTCHQRDFDEGRCSKCHGETDLAEMKPQTVLRHDSGWIRHHGVVATQSARACNQCHSEASCSDCHDQKQTIPIEVRRPDAIESNAIHKGDFISRHPIEAKLQPTTCLRCHAPSTCDACHVERGVSPNRVGSGSPHPQGWASGNPISPDFHGRAARRNIMQCAACHDQGPATNCILCHKPGGNGGNPHPNGWSSGRSKDASMCRYCHGT